MNVPPRSEAAPEFTWNAPSVFETPEAWKEAYAAVAASLPDALSRFQGKLGDNPAALLDWFEALGEVYRKAGHVFFYALMSQAVETTNQAANAMAGQAGGLMGRFQAAAAFAEPELLAIGNAKLDQWLRDEPRLQPYAHYFDDLFRRQQHVRSAEVEELLGLASDTFAQVENTSEVLANAEIAFGSAQAGAGEAIQVQQGNYETLRTSSDRDLRRTAWDSYSAGYLSVKNTLASNYAASVKRDVFMARARRFDTAIEASLFENNVPLEVFHNLVEHLPQEYPDVASLLGDPPQGAGGRDPASL